MYVKINIGANFCQVDKIKQFIHLIILIVNGYQQWQGTAPIFKRIININKVMFNFINQEAQNNITLDNKNIVEPKV